MIEMNKTVVDETIPRIKFACDLSVCKGACCTLPGGSGAPLLDDELIQLESIFPIVRSSLPPEHLAEIAQYGLYEGIPGSYTTMCFNHNACVFVMYENGIAKCSIEKAFHEGKTQWRKPISCHLFPIRIDRDEIHRLRYERISECDPALDRGEREKIRLSEFLKEPLVRAFGLSWYQDFQLRCSIEQNNNAPRKNVQK
jgi:hypothetical protein